MYCSHCGKEIDDDNSFCPFCGKTLTLDKQAQKSDSSKKKSNTLMVVVVALVVVAVVAAGAALYIKNNSKKDSSTADAGNKETVEKEKQDEANQVQIPQEAVEFEGHHYLVYDEPEYWSDAKERCEQLGGHLAAITSQNEQTFIQGLIEKTGYKYNYWLGGSDALNEGEWKWVTGESWSYTNWRDGQPDNRNNESIDGTQNYLQICCGSKDADRYMKWWDVANSGISEGYEDYPNYKDTQFTGFVCEWEE